MREKALFSVLQDSLTAVFHRKRQTIRVTRTGPNRFTLAIEQAIWRNVDPVSLTHLLRFWQTPLDHGWLPADAPQEDE